MSALDSIIRPIIKPILKPFLNERGRAKLYFIAKRSERNLFITAFICKLSLYKIAYKLGLVRKNPNGGGAKQLSPALESNPPKSVKESTTESKDTTPAESSAESADSTPQAPRQNPSLAKPAAHTPAPLIVSLTSFPARIGYLHHTLYSLFTQSDRDFAIALFLSEQEFPTRRLPLILRIFERLGLLRIHWVSENLRVYNKLFYAFRAYPDHAIITIDDDQIYSPQLIALLRASYARFPHCIHTNSAYTLEIPRALEIPLERYTPIMQESRPHIALAPLGVSGVLYPPHSFDGRFYDVESIRALCPIGDDLWFFVMSVLNGVEKVIISGALGHSTDPAIATFESPNLWEMNVEQDRNHPQLQALLKAYPQAKQTLLESLEKSQAESAELPEKSLEAPLGESFPPPPLIAKWL